MKISYLQDPLDPKVLLARLGRLVLLAHVDPMAQQAPLAHVALMAQQAPLVPLGLQDLEDLLVQLDPVDQLDRQDQLDLKYMKMKGIVINLVPKRNIAVNFCHIGTFHYFSVLQEPTPGFIRRCVGNKFKKLLSQLPFSKGPSSLLQVSAGFCRAWPRK